MSIENALTGSLTRIAAKTAYGWYALKYYERHFDICWSRSVLETGKMQDDWRRILAKDGQSENIYISAGDLFVMGPFLMTLQKDQALRDRIKKICIKRIRPEIFTLLAGSDKDYLPLISDSLRIRFDENVKDLKRAYGDERVSVLNWRKFPPFHGTLYRGYIHFANWVVDDGLLSHVTDSTFMKREKDEQVFGKMERLLHEGF